MDINYKPQHDDYRDFGVTQEEKKEMEETMVYCSRYCNVTEGLVEGVRRLKTIEQVVLFCYFWDVFFSGDIHKVMHKEHHSMGTHIMPHHFPELTDQEKIECGQDSSDN